MNLIPVVLGLDPGLQGGFAILSLEGCCLEFGPLPILGGKRRRIDIPSMALTLRHSARLGSRFHLAILEEPGNRPTRGTDPSADARGQTRGSVGTASFLREFGRLEGMLDTLGMPYQTVRPRAWQAAILGAMPSGIKPDQRRNVVKAESVAWCRRRFPAVSLTPGRRTKPHDGIADALGIAEFARRLVAGKE